MFISEERNGKLYSIPAKEVAHFSFSPAAVKILSVLSKKPSYPKEVAHKLGINEQNIYYHIRNLEKNGIIKIARREERGGAVAKFYTLTKPSFFVRFGEMSETMKIPRSAGWLEPFVSSGKLNARIVVGSPDPHGPERARSRDAYYAIDLGLFIGSFITSAETAVMLDTEISREELKKNLIIIGGPVINRVSKTINDRLPVRFDKSKNIYSALSKKIYKSDDCGIVVKAANPFSKESSILLIAGKRYSGTRAAIMAILKKLDEISLGNSVKRGMPAKVVEGVDFDGDGIVDDVKILE